MANGEDTPSGGSRRYDTWAENRQYVMRELTRFERDRLEMEKRLRTLEDFKIKAALLAGAAGSCVPILVGLVVKALKGSP